MRRLPLLTALGALALAGFAASGCNVLDGSQDSLPTSNNPQTLLQDANTAIQQGKPAEAIPYLERAIEKSEPGTLVKSESQLRLATATLLTNGLDVLSFESIVSDLSSSFDAAAAGRGGAQVCSFDGSGHLAGAPLDLDAIDGYQNLRLKISVLVRVRALVIAALGLPANPGAGFDLDAALAAFRAKGAPASLVSEAVLNASLAFIGTAYDRIARAGGDEIVWLRVTPPGGEGYLGYCAPSQAVIDRVKVETACSMTDLSFSVRLLKARAAFYGANAFATTIADKASEAYGRLEQELDGVCTIG